MRNQKQHRTRGRFLKHLEQGVRRLRVHLVGSIHDHHARPAMRRRQAEKRDQRAHILDRDLFAHHAAFVRGADHLL